MTDTCASVCHVPAQLNKKTENKSNKNKSTCLTRVTHNSLGLTNLWPSGSGSNWNLETGWFLRRGENRSTRRKTSRSKDENQQQTQPTYDTGTGSRTRATVVGGERSHHCAIPAPHKKRGTKSLNKMYHELHSSLFKIFPGKSIKVNKANHPLCIKL